MDAAVNADLRELIEGGAPDPFPPAPNLAPAAGPRERIRADMAELDAQLAALNQRLIDPRQRTLEQAAQEHRPPRPPTVELEEAAAEPGPARAQEAPAAQPPPDHTAEHAELTERLKRFRPGLADEDYVRTIAAGEAVAGRQGMRLAPYPLDYITNAALDTLFSIDEPLQAERAAPGAPMEVDVEEPAVELSPEEIQAQVCEMFPRVLPTWVAGEVGRGQTLEAIVAAVLDRNRNVPKKPNPKRKAVAAPTDENDNAPLDYFKRPRVAKSRQYAKEAEAELGQRFPRIALASLRGLLKHHLDNFAPTFQALQSEMALPAFASAQRGEEVKTSEGFPLPCLKLLKTVRTKFPRHHSDQELIDEIAWVNEWLEESAKSSAAAAAAEEAGEEEAAADGTERLECDICCGELPLTTFLPCLDGHLFCTTCVRAQATEVLHGQGGCEVSCLENGCKAGYSEEVMGKILSSTERAKLEERAGTAAVRAAGLADVVFCRDCPWGAEMPPKELNKVFKCGGEDCGAEWCRLCDRDWDDDHIGKRCEELETDAGAAERKRKEEALSAAILRRCHKCRTPFQKVEGCNKMTCRCGATSCYLCHAANIDYKHFCQHVRDPPGSDCKTCKGCNLYENPDKVDKERLTAVERELQSAS